MSEQDDKVKDLIKKAESLSNIGMHKEAIKVLLEANELKPKDYDILRLLGEEYCLYVDTEKGLDYFVEAMELKSNSLSPWIEYAYEYCSICKFDKAEKLILKAIELYPNSFNTYNLYNVLGCLYFKQCKYDKSMDNFIKASKSYIYNYAIWAELEDGTVIESRDKIPEIFNTSAQICIGSKVTGSTLPVIFNTFLVCSTDFAKSP